MWTAKELITALEQAPPLEQLSREVARRLNGSTNSKQEATPMTNYSVGNIIEQWCFGQAEHSRPVVVTQKYPEIKNGRPGFEGHIVGSGDGVWGYDSDVHRVLWPRTDQ